mgnify:CR=1 FL=1
MKARGFTIVELLIVIVVIAVLAAISIVAYNGVQQNARDSQRKSDLAAIAKAIKLYAIDNTNYVGSGSGCGAGGNGSGWMYGDYDGTGPWKSMSQCLVDGGYLSKALDDPQYVKDCDSASPPRECFRYMKYECSGGTWLYANLETMPHSTTDTDSSCMTTLDNDYGMNYSVRVN